MTQTLKLKRSAVQGRAPTTSDLELGELAINTTDGKIYIKKSVSGTESIAGRSSISFDTVEVTNLIALRYLSIIVSFFLL